MAWAEDDAGLEQMMLRLPAEVECFLVSFWSSVSDIWGRESWWHRARGAGDSKCQRGAKGGADTCNALLGGSLSPCPAPLNIHCFAICSILMPL